MKGRDNTTQHQSGEYDNQVEDTIPYYALFHKETIRLIKSLQFSPKYWLDTGCGTGTLIEKARVFFPETKFILIDPSDAMLELAKKKLSKIDDGTISFLEPSTTQDFSGKPGTMDVITAIQCHHYLCTDDRIKATEVCINLLKENGVYITFENIKPLTREGIKVGKCYWREFQLKQGRHPNTVHEHLKRFNREYFPITLIEHLNLLKKTGFRVVELFWYSYMQAGFYCIK